MTNKDRQIARIQRMETILDEILAAEEAVNSALDRLDSLHGLVKKLSAYYGSDAWKKDFQDDENGLLPADLKRGVLSEDGAYDALAQYRQIMARMLEAVSQSIAKGTL